MTSGAESILAMLVGHARSLRDAKSALSKFAAFDLPILIEGETGTGKELAARAVHYASMRARASIHPGELWCDPRCTDRE